MRLQTILPGRFSRRPSAPLPHDTQVAAETPSAEPRVYDEDVTLMQQVAAQDRQAFEQLYLRYAPRLVHYVTRLLRQPELVEEVVDDVMLVVWQRAADFRPQARVSTWIFGIAHHKAMKAWQRTSRHPGDTLPDTLVSDDAQSNPESALADQERHGLIMQAVQHLPPEQRAVLELTYNHDLSYQEIATITGCPLNTVRTRLLRARRQLAATLVALDPTSV